MIFLRYESFSQYIRYYPVTSLLILLNIVLFAAMEWDGSSVSPETLLKFGAMFGYPGAEPEVWRFFASIFLHIGFQHLLFNCFALFVFAPPLERLLGSVNYVVFYLVSGVLGNAVSHWLHSGTYLSAGASGAIYGIYASYLAIAVFRKGWIDAASRKTMTIVVAVGAVYSFLIPQVNWYAHLGGFVAGFLLMPLLIRFRSGGRPG